jgi:hypothetical protein
MIVETVMYCGQSGAQAIECIRRLLYDGFTDYSCPKQSGQGYK